MAHQTIADFRGGLDVRKGINAGTPGTFFIGTNVVLNDGGQIESRMAIVPWVDLPATSRGLAASGSKLYVFGPAGAPSVPSNMIYQALIHPGAFTLDRIVAWTMFAGLPYVLGAFSNGDVLHFYNGAVVAAWAPAGALYGQKATGCVTLGKKVYVIAGNTLHFCELDTPATFATGINGAGNIDMSTNSGGSESLTAIAVYIDRLAIFSSRNVQIWSVDADPAKNYMVQTLPTLGALSAMAAVSYGESDVFVLARQGVRSLRVREMSQTNLATTYDIGAPVDRLVRPATKAIGANVVTAAGVVDPLTTRFWVAIGGDTFVFSYFPSAQVSAWSMFDFGGTVDGFAVLDDRIYVRIGTGVFIYGGEDGATYDTSPYEVVLPFMDGKSPFTIKSIDGIDVGCEGRWDIEIGCNPEQPDTRAVVARVSGSTYESGRIPVGIQGNRASIRLSGSNAALNRLDSLVLHYTPYDDKDAGA